MASSLPTDEPYAKTHLTNKYYSNEYWEYVDCHLDPPVSEERTEERKQKLCKEGLRCSNKGPPTSLDTRDARANGLILTVNNV
jgi:hypothetical protein